MNNKEYKKQLVEGYFNEDSEFTVTKVLGSEYEYTAELLSHLKECVEHLPDGSLIRLECGSLIDKIIALTNEKGK